jgi:hypothetical protein
MVGRWCVHGGRTVCRVRGGRVHVGRKVHGGGIVYMVCFFSRRMYCMYMVGAGCASWEEDIFFIMYFSLPENIPPRPLGGTGVRKQWSALFYSIMVFNALHNNNELGNYFVGLHCNSLYINKRTTPIVVLFYGLRGNSRLLQ